MRAPIFKAVPDTHNDLVDLVNGETTIQVKNWTVVDQAVKFLCKCRPEVREKIINELANPNQWAVQLNQQPVLSCHHACASFRPLVLERN